MVDVISKNRVSGLYALVMVWLGLALGHSLVVLQHGALPVGLVDSAISVTIGLAGFALIWIGMKREEVQATLLGYLGGNLIWVGWFEWSWRYFGDWLALKPVMADGFEILSPELQMIQATVLVVIAMLIFLGANKDTRCRMFMWFHRNLKLRPGKMTPGYKRQISRTTAMETVFLIWAIYLFAIFINDPRGIRYDSITAMALTGLFLVWGIYLIAKLIKVRGLGTSFRYAIATGSICWLPIEAFSRWGLYPEIWIKPTEYPVMMSVALVLFVAGGAAMYANGREGLATAVA